MPQIRKYITRIDCFPRFTLKNGKYVFYGDGQGDFETSGYDALTKVVEDYIQDCIDQIEIARDFLKEKGEI